MSDLAEADTPVGPSERGEADTAPSERSEAEIAPEAVEEVTRDDMRLSPAPAPTPMPVARAPSALPNTLQCPLHSDSTAGGKEPALLPTASMLPLPTLQAAPLAAHAAAITLAAAAPAGKRESEESSWLRAANSRLWCGQGKGATRPVMGGVQEVQGPAAVGGACPPISAEMADSELRSKDFCTGSSLPLRN